MCKCVLYCTVLYRTVLLPPGVNPAAVNKHIHIYLYKPEHAATRDHLQREEAASCVDCVQFNAEFELSKGSSEDIAQCAERFLLIIPEESKIIPEESKRTEVRRIQDLSLVLSTAFVRNLLADCMQTVTLELRAQLSAVLHTVCCCCPVAVCKCRIASLPYTVVPKYLL